MKVKAMALSLLLFCSFGAYAKSDIASGIKSINRYWDKRPTQKHAILSAGECAAGIAFSSNPVGAAAVGLPVLALGNGLAYALRNVEPVNYLPNQDVVSIVRNGGRYVKNHPTLIQDASGSFCLAYGLTRSGRTKIKIKKPTNGGGDDGGSGSGGSGGSGGGNGGGGDNGGGGGNGGGGNGGCQQDCGLGGPNGGGNGGVNGGHDGNKPPFPGDPHRPIPE